MIYMPWYQKPEHQKKVLKAVNLSPPVNDDVFNKLEKVHPMKQIVWASITQIAVFGFMLLMFKIIGLWTG